MKKALTLTGLVALTGAALVLSGCCGSGSCPFKGKKEACTAPTAEQCACGAVKGSAECAAACKK